jgi:hypothetical protein
VIGAAHAFGAAGLHKPIALHVPAAPVESAGHGIVALHCTVHTMKPAITNA